MPIYAPTLPPRPEGDIQIRPLAVLFRFEWQRLRRTKLGRFFGFIFVGMFLAKLTYIYVRYLLETQAALKEAQGFANKIFAQGAEFQAGLLDPASYLLWFLVAMVGGGLIARDTLHRIRPLMYAHPVRPRDYLLAKLGFATALPLAILLPYVLGPWLMSLLIAGTKGPVWVSLPLLLIPAILPMSLLMGAVALGASSLAGTPRSGVAWVLGVVLGASALGGMLHGLLSSASFQALNPIFLCLAWPQLFCGVDHPVLGWLPTILGTTAHVVFWVELARRRTLPSEAVL
ncbi:MAG TPA: ABC transporter permease subunit [Holophagaceae bacterium]|nr:ABC transporter permease subunit [Holophagaceae bacterium]